MALHGGDVGSGRCKVAVVCDHVYPRHPSHPFMSCFVWLISADGADVGDPFVSEFSNVGGEVDGVVACNTGANTLCESANFAGVRSVPFRALAAA